MIKMRCLREHSSTVWGNRSAGDLFDVDDGYVQGLEEAGLAERVSKGAPPQPANRYEAIIAGDEPEPDPDSEPSVEDAIASLQAPQPITGQNTPARRGRRGR